MKRERKAQASDEKGAARTVWLFCLRLGCKQAPPLLFHFAGGKRLRKNPTHCCTPRSVTMMSLPA